MQTFKLASGHTVTTQRVSDAADVEFITKNAAGDVISSVRHSFAEAYPLLCRLTARARRR